MNLLLKIGLDLGIGNFVILAMSVMESRTTLSDKGMKLIPRFASMVVIQPKVA